MSYYVEHPDKALAPGHGHLMNTTLRSRVHPAGGEKNLLEMQRAEVTVRGQVTRRVVQRRASPNGWREDLAVHLPLDHRGTEHHPGVVGQGAFSGEQLVVAA